MNKHLTEAEKAARTAAEGEVLPERPNGPQLKKPKFMAGDAAAGRFWKLVLGRMQGLQVLDDLDSEMLATYCSMLSRYERIVKQAAQLSQRIEDMDGLEPKELVKLVEATNALESKTQALERNLLQYAEKLGLTPSGRARLAAKRAAAPIDDLDSDLFG